MHPGKIRPLSSLRQSLILSLPEKCTPEQSRDERARSRFSLALLQSSRDKRARSRDKLTTTALECEKCAGETSVRDDQYLSVHRYAEIYETTSGGRINTASETSEGRHGGAAAVPGYPGTR